MASALLLSLALAACSEKSSEPMEDARAQASGAPQRPAPQSAADQGIAEPGVIGGVPPPPEAERWGGPRKGAASATVDEPNQQVPDPAGPKVGAAMPQRKSSVMQAFASDVGGKLDSADVQTTIDKSADQLRACITVDSRVSVTVKVLVSGAVGDARAPRATPNDPKVRDCVAAVLRKLTFPRPNGNEAASISMDLDLRKQGSP